MYFVFVIETRHNSVSRDNSKIVPKEMSKLFSCDYLTTRRNVATEERNKKMMDFNCEEYLTSISIIYCYGSVKKMECSAYYRLLFTLKNLT